LRSACFRYADDVRGSNGCARKVAPRRVDSSLPVTFVCDCPCNISLWAALRRQTKTPNPSACLRVDSAGLCSRCISIRIIFWNRFGLFFRFGKQPLRASRIFRRWSIYLGSRNYSGRMANPAFAARPPVVTDAIHTDALPHQAGSSGKHNPRHRRFEREEMHER
jgi:hypothetical protein